MSNNEFPSVIYYCDPLDVYMHAFSLRVHLADNKKNNVVESRVMTQLIFLV